MIGYEPSEGKINTRLHHTVISASTVLPGLEALTGADLLVTNAPVPDDVRDLATDNWTQTISHLAWRSKSASEIREMVDKPMPLVRKVLKFRRACQSGLLVQRKTGSDLRHFASRYDEILVRMLNWTTRPWLLFVGDLKCSSGGFAVIDGSQCRTKYHSIQGALEAWQLGFQDMGAGYVTFLSRDKLVLPWLRRWERKLETLDETKLIGAKKPTRPVVMNSDDWVSTLCTLPNIRVTRALALAKKYKTLAACLEAVTDPELPMMEGRPKGIGMATVVRCRKWFGLEDDDLRLAVVMNIPTGDK